LGTDVQLNKVIRSILRWENGKRLPFHQEVALTIAVGGVAKYEADNRTHILAFTEIKDGYTIYTDDGVGGGLTVGVGPDDDLVVSHASGWRRQ